MSNRRGRKTIREGGNGIRRRRDRVTGAGRPVAGLQLGRLDMGRYRKALFAFGRDGLLFQYVV